jgi:hypothetical protein
VTKMPAFHTNSDEYRPEDKQVYHDNDECGHGKLIQTKHREPGTANRRRCDRCTTLAS